tara:strand:- start:22077 stop:23729 length:1653 start_codon:yes stop_codon:yes gene_type:complete
MATKVRDLEKKDESKKDEPKGRASLKQRSDQRKQRQMQQLEGTMAPIESRVGGLEMDTASVGVPAASSEGSPFKFASQTNAPAKTQATETGCGAGGCDVSTVTGGTALAPLTPMPTFDLTGQVADGAVAGSEPAAEPAAEAPQSGDSEATQIATTPASDFAATEITAGADPAATMTEASNAKLSVVSSKLEQIEADIKKYSGFATDAANWLSVNDEANRRNSDNWGMFDRAHNLRDSFLARVGQLETMRITALQAQGENELLRPIVESEANMNNAVAEKTRAATEAVTSQLPKEYQPRMFNNFTALETMLERGEATSAAALKLLIIQDAGNNFSANNPGAVQQQVANAAPLEGDAAVNALAPKKPAVGLQPGYSSDLVTGMQSQLMASIRTVELAGTLKRIKNSAQLSKDDTARHAVYSDAGKVLAKTFVNDYYLEHPEALGEDNKVVQAKISQQFATEIDLYTTGAVPAQTQKFMQGANPTGETTETVRDIYNTEAELLKSNMPNFILEQVQARQAPADESPITRMTTQTDRMMEVEPGVGQIPLGGKQ